VENRFSSEGIKMALSTQALRLRATRARLAAEAAAKKTAEATAKKTVVLKGVKYTPPVVPLTVNQIRSAINTLGIGLVDMEGSWNTSVVNILHSWQDANHLTRSPVIPISKESQDALVAQVAQKLRTLLNTVTPGTVSQTGSSIATVSHAVERFQKLIGLPIDGKIPLNTDTLAALMKAATHVDPPPVAPTMAQPDPVQPLPVSPEVAVEIVKQEVTETKKATTNKALVAAGAGAAAGFMVGGPLGAGIGAAVGYFGGKQFLK
jgi:hypothetical protein